MREFKGIERRPAATALPKRRSDWEPGDEITSQEGKVSSGPANVSDVRRRAGVKEGGQAVG